MAVTSPALRESGGITTQRNSRPRELTGAHCCSPRQHVQGSPARNRRRASAARSQKTRLARIAGALGRDYGCVTSGDGRVAGRSALGFRHLVRPPSEIDTGPLVARAARAGMTAFAGVLSSRDQPLSFRRPKPPRVGPPWWGAQLRWPNRCQRSVRPHAVERRSNDSGAASASRDQPLPSRWPTHCQRIVHSQGVPNLPGGIRYLAPRRNDGRMTARGGLGIA